MINLKFKYESLIKNLKDRAPFVPDLAIILGSGLGDFVSQVNTVEKIPTDTLENYPASTVHGHAGNICFSESNGKKLLLFQGRIHFYEGYHISECILPVYLSHQLGCKKILFTNAAGGINPNLSPGSLMLNSSFNSIYLKKEITELIGLASKAVKDRFLDFPSKKFSNLIHQAAIEEGILLHEGVYWYSKGPSYETPAEIKMIRKFGADAVGMSTVHEGVFASYLGMDVASISCITNFAAGITQFKLSHEEVTITANMVKTIFEKLLKGIINLS
ncbi:MAG: purine-nucleoside phosphorylase [Bacillota bacterium]